MTQNDLLISLQQQISPEELQCLQSKERLIISAFNREVLLEMAGLVPSLQYIAPVAEDKITDLNHMLEQFLGKELADKPSAWKWIKLACLYLGFIAKRPLHPIDAVDIAVTRTRDGILYECPMKDTNPGTVCQYCVCIRKK